MFIQKFEQSAHFYTSLRKTFRYTHIDIRTISVWYEGSDVIIYFQLYDYFIHFQCWWGGWEWVDGVFRDISFFFPVHFGSLYLHIYYLFCDLPLTPCWFICIQIHIISMPPITVVSTGAPRLSKCKKKSGRCSNILVSLLVEIAIKIYFWIPYLSTRIYYYLGT